MSVFVNGIINLGTAENKTCEDIVLPKINELLSKGIDQQCLYYYQLHGLDCMKKAISQFLSGYFNLKKQIDQAKLTICTGVTSAISMLAMAIADENETILCLGPCYGRFMNDLQELANTKFQVVEMWKKDADFGTQGNLRVEVLKEALIQAESKNQIIKAVIVTNPDNPTGQVHSTEEILDILQFCKEKKLHVLLDEIYALSTHSNGKYVSGFQMELPDPERTHIMWGLSKDFGLSGLRFGVIYTENSWILQYLSTAAIFSTIPAMVQRLLCDFLSDSEWVYKTYLRTYQTRKEENLKILQTIMETLHIPIYPAGGGLFLWVNLQQFLQEKTEHCEIQLFKTLLDSGVYIVPGSKFFCSEPGWFRIVFTVDKNVLIEGLKRFQDILRDHMENRQRNYLEIKRNN